MLVHETKAELGFGVALAGRLLVPAERLGMVLGDVVTVVMHLPKVVLGAGAALSDCLVVLAHHFFIAPVTFPLKQIHREREENAISGGSFHSLGGRRTARRAIRPLMVVVVVPIVDDVAGVDEIP